MKTISKYNYLQKLITNNAKEYRKVILQIPDDEYNKIFGIKPNPNPDTSYSYTYSYGYTYAYSYAYNNSYNNAYTCIPAVSYINY